MSLTAKQAAFVREYVQCWNATEAARRAGYRGSDEVLATTGSENLRKPKVSEKISEIVERLAMPQGEALMRMAEIARGGHSAYIQIIDDSGEDGEIRNLGVDIERLVSEGKAYLVKSITPTRYGQKIEFYDMQSALETILKATGALRDNININTVDLTKLNDSQLERLANGEDLFAVLANPDKGAG